MVFTVDTLTQVTIFIRSDLDTSENVPCTYCSLSVYLRNKGIWQIIVTSGVGVFLNPRDRLKVFMLSSNNFSTVTLSLGLH